VWVFLVAERFKSVSHISKANVSKAGGKWWRKANVEKC